MKRIVVLMLMGSLLLTGCSTNSSNGQTPMTQKDEQYTAEYLNSIMDDINDYFLSAEEHDELAKEFVGAGIYDNRVVVEFLHLNDDTIALFKETISDSDAIVFDKGEPAVDD